MWRPGFPQEGSNLLPGLKPEGLWLSTSTCVGRCKPVTAVCEHCTRGYLAVHASRASRLRAWIYASRSTRLRAVFASLWAPMSIMCELVGFWMLLLFLLLQPWLQLHVKLRSIDRQSGPPRFVTLSLSSRFLGLKRSEGVFAPLLP